MTSYRIDYDFANDRTKYLLIYSFYVRYRQLLNYFDCDYYLQSDYVLFIQIESANEVFQKLEITALLRFILLIH